MKKRILFVGENPLSCTGNGNMMQAILESMDMTSLEVSCFASLSPDHVHVDPFMYPSIPIIEAEEHGDTWGTDKLLRILRSHPIDIVIFVGIDIWRYSHAFKDLIGIRQHKGMKYVWIFPYDLWYLREDWIEWINLIDYPCVYSEYGYEQLKDHVPHLRYFRPPLANKTLFYPLDRDQISEFRHKAFRSVRDDELVFGFVGASQIRKDPQKVLRAFMEAREELNGGIYLYMHTDFGDGLFNLRQAAVDYKGKTGWLISKHQGMKYSPEEMVKIYNALDCLINCSMQEGLSWTVLEAQLCGVPVIASYSTAQMELIEDGAGYPVPCKQDSYVPLIGSSGKTMIDSKSCSVADIKSAIIDIAKDGDLRSSIAQKGRESALEWVSKESSINALLEDIWDEEQKVVVVTDVRDEILFAQHSSAGDVLMTTQCFKGIKEKYLDKKLIYMTQPIFQDIVKNNPYIDEIVDWDEALFERYKIVYNPHGERILPGGFNNLDVPLWYMYPYFCKVEGDQMYIEKIAPNIELPDEYLVVHTTGGHPVYRTYEHMDIVLQILKSSIDIKVIQIGGASDKACNLADLDLRGKTSWRETAYIMDGAKAAVVIDSFPSHLAGALGVPVIVLYGPAPARVVGPKGDPDKIVNLEPNKLDVCPSLTNCWGRPGEAVCQSPCINTINPMEVLESLTKLLKGDQE